MRFVEAIGTEFRDANLSQVRLKDANFSKATLDQVTVDTKDWLAQLKEMKVKGAGKLKRQHQINAHPTEEGAFLISGPKHLP